MAIRVHNMDDFDNSEDPISQKTLFYSVLQDPSGAIDPNTGAIKIIANIGYLFCYSPAPEILDNSTDGYVVFIRLEPLDGSLDIVGQLFSTATNDYWFWDLSNNRMVIQGSQTQINLVFSQLFMIMDKQWDPVNGVAFFTNFLLREASTTDDNLDEQHTLTVFTAPMEHTPNGAPVIILQPNIYNTTLPSLATDNHRSTLYNHYTAPVMTNPQRELAISVHPVVFNIVRKVIWDCNLVVRLPTQKFAIARRQNPISFLEQIHHTQVFTDPIAGFLGSDYSIQMGVVRDPTGNRYITGFMHGNPVADFIKGIAVGLLPASGPPQLFAASLIAVDEVLGRRTIVMDNPYHLSSHLSIISSSITKDAMHWSYAAPINLSSNVMNFVQNKVFINPVNTFIPTKFTMPGHSDLDVYSIFNPYNRGHTISNGSLLNPPTVSIHVLNLEYMNAIMAPSLKPLSANKSNKYVGSVKQSPTPTQGIIRVQYNPHLMVPLISHKVSLDPIPYSFDGQYPPIVPGRTTFGRVSGALVFLPIRRMGGRLSDG